MKFSFEFEGSTEELDACAATLTGPDGGATLARILTHVKALHAQGEQMATDTAQLKKDLEIITSDLEAIKVAVGTTVGDQQKQIADLQTTIASLQAGDVLTQQNIDDLTKQGDAAAASAEAIKASVTPVPPPV